MLKVILCAFLPQALLFFIIYVSTPNPVEWQAAMNNPQDEKLNMRLK